ncbi:MAG: rpmE2 [Chlamydiales bacterium]|jgi:large subunit ribosomal protein L31|nr:rpmE2 [Chlamydiales bacterium]
MKENIHPKYQNVLFIDTATQKTLICGSTMQPTDRKMHEGVEYPVIYLSVSSTSHPFFTGSNQLIDTEGRVDKFNKRYGKK